MFRIRHLIEPIASEPKAPIISKNEVGGFAASGAPNIKFTLCISSFGVKVSSEVLLAVDCSLRFNAPRDKSILGHSMNLLADEALRRITLE